MAPDKPSKKMTGIPREVVGPGDLGRLRRELEEVNEKLIQAKLRKQDDNAALPPMSSLLDKTVALNRLDMHDESDRLALGQFLTAIGQQAPVLHVSFSADPSPLFTQKLVSWLRKEIHPLVLLTVGIQPTLAAGCIIRTRNKYFDFSLRQHLLKQTEVLVTKIREVNTAGEQK